MNAIAATEDNIQDQNLVNDQITAAIDKLSETAAESVGASPAEPAQTPAPAATADPVVHEEPVVHEAAPAAEPQQQPAPSILEEHEESSTEPADENSIGSINLGSVPVETESHPEPAVEEHTSQAVPPPAISDSDITSSLPVADEPHEDAPATPAAPAAPADSPIAAPIAITLEPAVEEKPAPAKAPATIDVKEASSDLDYLRSKALAELAPIVDNLEVSQEQKYKTVMETFEATKDNSLLQQAFDFASVIPDDKAKAEALQNILDRIH
jgi:hypothetical protein